MSLAACLLMALSVVPSQHTDPAGLQGNGAQSPLAGQNVELEGIVVARFPERRAFIVQSRRGDRDAATAEGVLVVLSSPPDSESDAAAVAAGWEIHAPAGGRRVTVLGKAEEVDGMTAVVGAAIARSRKGKLPKPVVLADAPADWEALEGMRVRIAAPLTLLDSQGLARRGELQVAFGGRLPGPTEIVAPGEAAKLLSAEIARRSLRLSGGVDAAPVAGVDPLPTVPGAAFLRVGSTLDGIAGVVLQDKAGYILVPDADAMATVTPAPRPAPPNVAGALRLGSFNVLNLFNGDGRGAGFPTLRGAKTADEYARQQAKLVASIQTLAPDAAALMEIENDGYGPESALAQFVAALNAAGPVRDYAFVDAGSGPGDNPIRVAIVYRTSKLHPHGEPRTAVGGPFAEQSRVPLAQAFAIEGAPAGTPPLKIVAVHLKSKGCGTGAKAASGADIDRGDGQSCFNATRTESALRLALWLASDRRDNERTVLLGDFNSYAQEDPLRVLHDAGWTDAFALLPEPGAPYSFVFNGLAGRLDHALLDADAAALLRGAAHWHSNADEPEASGYAAGLDASAYGASDHDPLVIGLDW